MQVREFTLDDVEMLDRWSGVSEDVTEVLRDTKGFSTMDWIGVVENDAPVAVVAGQWQPGSPRAAVVHVIVDPEQREFAVVSKVYDHALLEAKRQGVKVAIGVIPEENRAALAMAKRKGFTLVRVGFKEL